MTVRIINADVLAGLAELPDESVHCVVTSPPYWGLRDYGQPGQIGLEATPEAFVARMVEVFREVRRVLRQDGTCWLNLGDSYAGSWGNQGRKEERGTQRPINGPMMQNLQPYPDKQSNTGKIPEGSGLKPKDLIGIPWRVALALQADGWWLRSDVIWSKPNPMPESVTDRPTKSHEYLFLLTKAERYYYDAEAIKEVAVRAGAAPGGNRSVDASRNDAARDMSKPVEDARNARSVWTIATAPFAEAHFATFPPELPARCIKAGCPPGGTVLDCFGGAGTTGLVADRLQRNAILIELNPEYAAMAERRIAQDAGGLFASVAVQKPMEYQLALPEAAE
jgi:DNA modification methylase